MGFNLSSNIFLLFSTVDACVGTSVPSLLTSLNRFFLTFEFLSVSSGKISTLWHKLKYLMQFYEAQFSIWQKFLPTLVNFVNNWTIFHGCKWTNNENYKSHLVTLSVSHNILSLPFMFFLKVLSEMALSKYLFLSQNYLCYSLSLSLSLFFLNVISLSLSKFATCLCLCYLLSLSLFLFLKTSLYFS